MSGIRSIIYFSSATKLLTEAELEALLIDSRDWNQEHGITGILLYVDGLFMQCLEGLEGSMSQTFMRICHSSQHKDMIKVFDASIDKLNFPNWLMGLSRPEKSELLKFHSVNWEESMRGGGGGSIGMKLLKTFWENNNR
jgi:hypothetical protein